LDVTSFVRTQGVGDGVVSLMLADSSKSSKMSRFDSREGSNAPAIVVD
jgi:hypothetical protein